LFPGPTGPGTPGAAKCPEPLCTIKVLPLSSWCLAPCQWALPHFHRSYGLMRPSSTLPPPRLYPRTVGLCRLLSAPAGRRTFPTLFCASFSACLDPYPGGSWSASTRFFLHDIGLPRVRTGSALRNTRTATSIRHLFSRLQSFTHVQARRFARHPGCSHRSACARRPWLLHPSRSRFVTSPCPGYANRPFRATDGRRTSTSQDSQPCRLLPQRPSSRARRMMLAKLDDATRRVLCNVVLGVIRAF
jgi:hypothetical protein